MHFLDPCTPSWAHDANRAPDCVDTGLITHAYGQFTVVGVVCELQHSPSFRADFATVYNQILKE
jgi:hypothetical protein